MQSRSGDLWAEVERTQTLTGQRFRREADAPTAEGEKKGWKFGSRFGHKDERWDDQRDRGSNFRPINLRNSEKGTHLRDLPDMGKLAMAMCPESRNWGERDRSLHLDVRSGGGQGQIQREQLVNNGYDGYEDGSYGPSGGPSGAGGQSGTDQFVVPRHFLTSLE